MTGLELFDKVVALKDAEIAALQAEIAKLNLHYGLLCEENRRLEAALEELQKPAA